MGHAHSPVGASQLSIDRLNPAEVLPSAEEGEPVSCADPCVVASVPNSQATLESDVVNAVSDTPTALQELQLRPTDVATKEASSSPRQSIAQRSPVGLRRVEQLISPGLFSPVKQDLLGTSGISISSTSPRITRLSVSPRRTVPSDGAPRLSRPIAGAGSRSPSPLAREQPTAESAKSPAQRTYSDAYRLRSPPKLPPFGATPTSTTGALLPLQMHKDIQAASKPKTAMALLAEDQKRRQWKSDKRMRNRESILRQPAPVGGRPALYSPRISPRVGGTPVRHSTTNTMLGATRRPGHAHAGVGARLERPNLTVPSGAYSQRSRPMSKQSPFSTRRAVYSLSSQGGRR